MQRGKEFQHVRVELINAQNLQAQWHLFLIPSRLEAAKDDYRIRCEELEKELLDVKSQNEDLTSLADEAQSLKDEIDVLRYFEDAKRTLNILKLLN